MTQTGRISFNENMKNRRYGVFLWRDDKLMMSFKLRSEKTGQEIVNLWEQGATQGSIAEYIHHYKVNIEKI